ncbi:hypothetical protein [Sphingomonas profundi]|uniref:hypothetical protein n=1 Tax=Alterirhizorhabdus profundi TaxID=2681549 RepID=UPI0012E868F2|nr:hypothetical protein [Sphingomonas profundi]
MTLQETIDSPAAHAAQPASFHDLMASIGYLLFQWSLLDRTLDDEIARLRRAGGELGDPATRTRTINERLAEWRALIERGRRRASDRDAIESVATRIQDYQRLRNLVATGFVSAASGPDAPSIRCAHGTTRRGVADEVRMSAGDIVDTIDAIELCRSEMALLRDLGGR